MQITLNTEELSEKDRNILAFIAGGGKAPAAATTTPIAEQAKPAAAAKKAAAPKAAEPEAAAAENDGTPTLEDAVAAATKLVSTGNAAKVKAALADVGAKRVSELAEDAIPAFLAALDA